MAETYDMANKGRNMLRGKVRALQQENAGMIAFIAEFGLWLEKDKSDSVMLADRNRDSYSEGQVHQASLTLSQWHHHKTKHLDGAESEEVTG